VRNWALCSSLYVALSWPFGVCPSSSREILFRTELEPDRNRPLEECPVHPMGRLYFIKRVLLSKFVSIMHTWLDMCAKFPQIDFPPYLNMIETVASYTQWLQDPVQQQRDAEAATLNGSGTTKI
jgi:hypothetical protein